VGVAMDVNDLLHEAMMEMAQNDTHPLQAMWQNISHQLSTTCHM
jgi:hypothetical protein